MLFLDGIGELPLPLQGKILRVLQEQTFERLGSTRTIKVDVRIIAATHRNLEEMVKRGEFREDLYWRLNVVPLFIPPLRERKKDIPLLVNHFIQKFNALYGKQIKIKPEALEILLKYPFPGNVRELENLIERLVLLTEGEWINPEDLKKILKIKEIFPEVKTHSSGSFLEELEKLERERILKDIKRMQF